MHQLTAYEIHQKFLAGELSATEIVHYFLQHIEMHNPTFKAFTSILKERALKKAQQLDEKKARGDVLGKLAGIPIAIKDNINIEGELTTCASKFLTNYTAPFSATVVTLLEDADAIIIGKTNLDEFAMGSSGENSAGDPSRNPWNLSYSPGGSSSGSAVSVAAQLCPVALGSDTGGSIRQPASLCGVVGYKPTYGRTSRYGLVAFGSSLDQIGPITRSTQDLAMVMEVLGKHCPYDSTSAQKETEEYQTQLKTSLDGMKIGVPYSFLEDLQEEPRRLFDQSLETLKNLGAELVDINLDLLKYSISTYYILSTAEASTNLARFDGIRYGKRSEEAKTLDEVYDLSREDGFGPEVKRRILLGTFVLSSGYKDAFYTKAQKVRQMIIDQFKTAFKSTQLIAMPTAPFGAFELGSLKNPLQMYLEDIYTIPANLAGLPAINIPATLNQNGLPIGLQLLGPQLEDVRVCAAAHAFEQATQFVLTSPETVKQ